jgi:anti-sigma-K factor RskA
MREKKTPQGAMPERAMSEKRNPPRTAAQKISDLTLEQYHLGELGAAQERRVRRELERDEVLRGRLAGIVSSDGQIRIEYPAERMVPLIRERALREESASLPGAGERRAGERRAEDRRAGERRPWRIPTLAWAIPVAAMALVLLSLPIFLRPSDETRLKGAAPHLLVFRKTATGAEELAPGSVARKGDVLQLSYVAGEAKYGVIFSVDGRGTVTWHVPPRYAGGALAAPALDPNGPALLPKAYELDDAPGFERFFLVYSSRPFQVADVERIARALAAGGSGDRTDLKLGRGLGQFSLLVKKQG